MRLIDKYVAVIMFIISIIAIIPVVGIYIFFVFMAKVFTFFAELIKDLKNELEAHCRED